MSEYLSMRLGTVRDIKNKPTNPLEQIMAEIVDFAATKLNDGAADPDTLIATINPKLLISMLTANITINLFLSVISRSPDVTSKSRAILIKELADTIHFMILDCYRHIEGEMPNGETLN